MRAGWDRRGFPGIGFDDVIEAKTAVPALTTVSVDPHGMGERAAELLLKQINSGRVEPEANRQPGPARHSSELRCCRPDAE